VGYFNFERDSSAMSEQTNRNILQ